MTAPSPLAHGPLNPPAEADATSSAIVWSDPARGAAFGHWLARIAPTHGLAAHTVRLASADASFRRYFRVDTLTPGLSCIVMDAPPALEDARPFVRIAQLLHQAQVRAPRVLEWSQDDGFLLLDDLGARTLLDVIERDNPAANLPLYEQAIDALIAWQRSSQPGVLPPYDAALLQRELALFPDWYVARHRGIELQDSQRQTLDEAFARIVQSNLAAPSVYVHRDFMPRNLMVADAGPGAALGVLDFQDAVYGPITYDIASLMRDAFLSWDEEFVVDVTVRYWQAARKAQLPVDEDFGSFYRAVEWMGLQRHLKVAGIFARLTLRDGKPKYLADAPRFMAYIRATAGRYRELTPLLRLLDQLEGSAPATGFAFGRV